MMGGVDRAIADWRVKYCTCKMLRLKFEHILILRFLLIKIELELQDAVMDAGAAEGISIAAL